MTNVAARDLTQEDLGQLASELAREDLQVYTVVRLAQRDLAAGAVDSALARLRVDADKLRSYSTSLNELLTRQVKEPLRGPGWALTLEGQKCRCNYCHTQFSSQPAFSLHWGQCPVRVRAGYVDPAIYPS